MIRSKPNFMKRLAIGLVAGSCVAGVTDPVAAQSPAAADSSHSVAFVLTISGTLRGIVPIPVADIRAAVSDQLTATWTRRGFSVAPREDTFSLMRKWRVRDGSAISRGFLEELVDSMGVRVLVVTNLIFRTERVIMTARYLNTDSGILQNVALMERAVDRRRSGEAEVWLAAARGCAQVIGDASVGRSLPGRKPLLILDTQPLGCSATDALIADHTLLAYYVKHGRHTMVDPAVTTATLYNAGYSDRSIGADARGLLQKTFECRRLVIPQLISYAPARRPSTQLETFDAPAQQHETTVPDFSMSLRLIDLGTGAIAAGKEVFMALPEPVGWFGVPRHETLMDRLQVTAGQLWSDMKYALEDI